VLPNFFNFLPTSYSQFAKEPNVDCNPVLLEVLQVTSLNSYFHERSKNCVVRQRDIICYTDVTTHQLCCIDALRAADYLAKGVNILYDVGKDNGAFVGM
jgi:hypothetical protein